MGDWEYVELNDEEINRLWRQTRGEGGPIWTRAEANAVIVELWRLRKVIERIAFLHHRIDNDELGYCEHCGDNWPCATVEAFNLNPGIEAEPDA